MTYATEQLWTTGSSIAGASRTTPVLAQPKTFANVSGAPTLEQMTPVAFDEVTGTWKVWSGYGVTGKNETASLAVNATGGTFTITVEGVATAAIAYNATAAAVQAALLLLPGLSPGDLVVTGGPGDSGATTPYVITWGGVYKGKDAPTVTSSGASLTGGSTTVVVTTVAGVDLSGVDKVRGFVWPDAIELDATNDVIGVVLLKGEVHYDDIVLPAGESAATLKEALRDGPRELGLDIIGLSAVR